MAKRISTLKTVSAAACAGILSVSGVVAVSSTVVSPIAHADEETPAPAYGTITIDNKEVEPGDVLKFVIEGNENAINYAIKNSEGVFVDGGGTGSADGGYEIQIPADWKAGTYTLDVEGYEATFTVLGASTTEGTDLPETTEDESGSSSAGGSENASPGGNANEDSDSEAPASGSEGGSGEDASDNEASGGSTSPGGGADDDSDSEAPGASTSPGGGADDDSDSEAPGASTAPGGGADDDSESGTPSSSTEGDSDGEAPASGSEGGSDGEAPASGSEGGSDGEAPASGSEGGSGEEAPVGVTPDAEDPGNGAEGGSGEEGPGEDTKVSDTHEAGTVTVAVPEAGLVAGGVVSFTVEGATAEKLAYSLKNAAGEEVQTGEAVLADGSYTLTLNDDLAAGTYTLTVDGKSVELTVAAKAAESEENEEVKTPTDQTPDEEKQESFITKFGGSLKSNKLILIILAILGLLGGVGAAVQQGLIALP